MYLKFVALPNPGIIKSTRKIWAVPGYDHAPVSLKSLKDFKFVRLDPMNVVAKFEFFEVRIFTPS